MSERTEKTDGHHVKQIDRRAGALRRILRNMPMTVRKRARLAGPISRCRKQPDVEEVKHD